MSLCNERLRVFYGDVPCSLPHGHEGNHRGTSRYDSRDVWWTPTEQDDSDIKLAGEALELIRRTKEFTAAHPTGPIMEAHDALRAFIHGGTVNQ